MAYSKLYDTILNQKFFIDIKQIDTVSWIIDKFLKKDIRDYDASKLSESKPLKPKMKDIDIPVFAASGNDGKEGGRSQKQVVAIIPLHGTMIKYGTMCSYGADEIAEAIDNAAAEKKVIGIVLDIDSGGGAVDAVAPLVDAIKRCQRMGKPVVASCDLCASAAYWTACECNEIIANNSISSEFGSIGVMMQFPDYAKYYEKEGIKVHTIYSNLSTYKNAPFELAKKGEYESIKTEELDPLARKFQSTVQSKRAGKLDEKVEGILNGRMFYAEDALKNGLIDSIGTTERAVERVRQLVADNTIHQYMNKL